MNTFDDLLLNILALTVPILLYPIFWLEKQILFMNRLSKYGIGVICALSALFCMTHPFFYSYGSNYDLRAIPILLAFLYSSRTSGLFVCACVLTFGYYLGEPVFASVLVMVGMLIPLSLTFIILANWKQRTPKLMFPTLLSLLGSITIVCINFISRITYDLPIGLDNILFGFFYCAVHTVTMWLITFFIERIKENLIIRQEVQRAEKMNVLSELAASVAHEIRNPMTVARGFMQILSQSKVAEEKKQTYMEMVIEEIDRAQSIINDYLSFAKPQAERLEKLSVCELILKLANLITPYASLNGVQISFNVEPSLWISANSEKMIQCLVNLTKNGIEAMPEGGILTINGRMKQEKVILEINDNGIGMTAEQVERLGTPFYSTKNKGTGLGMMVSYRIIKTFGGMIEVSSELGKGSRFLILLPAFSKDCLIPPTGS
ncbi:Sporulation kinase E [compost metagenome]